MLRAGRLAFFTVTATTIAISSVSAQTPVQLKYSRVVDLTLPIESNMAGIPGLKSYAENPFQSDRNCRNY